MTKRKLIRTKLNTQHRKRVRSWRANHENEVYKLRA